MPALVAGIHEFPDFKKALAISKNWLPRRTGYLGSARNSWMAGLNPAMTAVLNDSTRTMLFYPPLTAPAVSPATIWRWAKMVRNSTGSVTISAAAESGPQLTCSNESML